MHAPRPACRVANMRDLHDVFIENAIEYPVGIAPYDLHANVEQFGALACMGLAFDRLNGFLDRSKDISGARRTALAQIFENLVQIPPARDSGRSSQSELFPDGGDFVLGRQRSGKRLGNGPSFVI